jgi:hypothetical protein
MYSLSAPEVGVLSGRGSNELRGDAATILVVAGALVAGVSGTAFAQELEPRAYRTLPTGLNFLVLNFTRSDGNVLVDLSLPIEDLEATLDTATVGYLRSLAVAGRSASVTVLVPYVHGTLSGLLEGEFSEGSRSGAGDLRVRFAVNLLGGPALAPREFAAYRQGRNVGVSMTMIAPSGQYDSSRAINFGANRWGFKPEIGYSSIRGRWIFEAAAGVWLFTDNSDFVGVTREQRPIGSFQAHLSYNFDGGVWLGLGGNYYTGGRTTVDGTRNADLQESSRVGLTLSLPVGDRHSFKLSTHAGAFTRIGADFDVASFSYQLRW